MRLACVRWNGTEKVGIVSGDGKVVKVKDIGPDEVWRHADSIRLEGVERAADLEEIEVGAATLLPPVPRPAKVLCVAANYYAHMQEGGLNENVDEVRPQFFMKPPTTTLIGHQATFHIPSNIGFLDYEGELAVVIGKRLYQAADHEEAMSAVGGYSALNDLSERSLGFDPRDDKRANTWFFDWLAGKWLDGGAPFGPWVVTADEIADPQNLKIELRLNGEVMQSSSTSFMMSPVADLVWYASQFMTLEPGDVIATGTPEGVGQPKGIYLKDGDTTELTVEGIGTLTTRYQG